MAKPAARKGIDQAGHAGPIITGSPNVFIGGAPAARMGDSFTCSDSKHGSGVIIGGSGTVFINGMPAARMDDATLCNSGASPAAGNAAPTRHLFVTPVKSSNEDGTVKTRYPDNIDMKVLNAYVNLSDRSGSGSYDHINSGAVFQEAMLQGRTGEKGGWGIGGSIGKSVAKVDGTVGGIVKENEYIYVGEAKTTGLAGSASLNLGKEDLLYAEGTAEGAIGYAEARAQGELYTGEGGKYGGYAEIGAEAAVAKGELTGEGNIFSVIKFKSAVSATAGGVGASGGIGGYVDKNKMEFNFRASGEVALLLGLGADIDITLNLSPVIKSIKEILNDNYTQDGNEGGNGSILTGISTVLIGG